jgi:outer membrane protein OmpA-like peptidoglycan-associated protein
MKEDYIYDCTTFRTPDDIAIKKYFVPRDLLLAKLEINQVFTVGNIYYDLDKWFIRKDAEEPLDNLVRIMKEFPISAELSSHTDSRATHEYNNELSQKRAESAVRYIVLQGISPRRITAKGYGEVQLVNECADGVNCTEEQHQANRRTEFRITGIDASLLGQDPFNLNVFKVGDVISAKLLDANFFTNCLVEKKSLQDYLKSTDIQKKKSDS